MSDILTPSVTGDPILQAPDYSSTTKLMMPSGGIPTTSIANSTTPNTSTNKNKFGWKEGIDVANSVGNLAVGIANSVLTNKRENRRLDIEDNYRRQMTELQKKQLELTSTIAQNQGAGAASHFQQEALKLQQQSRQYQQDLQNMLADANRQYSGNTQSPVVQQVQQTVKAGFFQNKKNLLMLGAGVAVLAIGALLLRGRGRDARLRGIGKTRYKVLSLRK